MFRAVIKGEEGVNKPKEFDSKRLFDKGESLIAANKGIKSSSLTMVSLNEG